jgi:hypothetical protein
MCQFLCQFERVFRQPCAICPYPHARISWSSAIPEYRDSAARRYPRGNAITPQPRRERVPQIVVSKIIDCCFLKARLKPPSAAMHFAASGLPNNWPRWIAVTPLMKFPECRQSDFVQGNCISSSSFGPWQPHDFPIEINILPAKRRFRRESFGRNAIEIAAPDPRV